MGNQLPKGLGLDYSFYPIILWQVTRNVSNFKMFSGLYWLLTEEFEVTVSLDNRCRGKLGQWTIFSKVFWYVCQQNFSFPMVAGGNFQCPATRASPKVCQELQMCFLASETNIFSIWKSSFLSISLESDITSVCYILFLQKESLNSSNITTVFIISVMGGKSIQEFVYMFFF